MTKLRLMLVGGLLMLGLAACNSASAPATDATAQPGASTPPAVNPQPTSSVTSIPESEYPNPYVTPTSP